MPLQRRNPPTYRPERDITVEWNSFNGGWNSLFKPTELKPNELSQADNLMLIGAGTPTGRWGSQLYHLAGSGSVRLLDAFYKSTVSQNDLLTITDLGFLTKKSAASYSIITGTSFASGSIYQSAQLGNNLYIASASLPFVKYDGVNLIPYVALSTPTNVSVAQLSAASGFTTWSWLVTAFTKTGQTLNSVAKSLASLPLDITQTSVKVSWNTVSAASGILQGQNIYRGFPGMETFIGATDPTSTQFIDTGTPQSNTIFPPLVDTTAGIRAKYILKFDDRIILAGVMGDPSRVYISARYPFQDQFNALAGGGYILVSPDDGDDITGLGIAGNQGMSSGGSAPPSSAILVFKKNSVHRVVLSFVTLGNYSILDPQAQLLTSSNGCSSADTVQAVENDTYYFGRKGLYTVGQEPNFLNQIRTNEISARIRPYIQSLSDSDFSTACAGYLDNKYVLSFPNKKEVIIYDRERAAFMGPWKMPWGVTKILKYIDGAGVETWLFGTDSGGKVYQMLSSLLSDSGTARALTLRSKKESLGKWSIMKVLKLWYTLFRNVRGNMTANLRIETPTGNTVTTKTFQVSGSLGDGGWGSDQYGSQQYGQSEATVVLSGDELVRWSQIYKTCRVIQVEILTTGSTDNFEFLGTRFTAQGLGDSSLPATDRV